MPTSPGSIGMTIGASSGVRVGVTRNPPYVGEASHGVVIEADSTKKGGTMSEVKSLKDAATQLLELRASGSASIGELENAFAALAEQAGFEPEQAPAPNHETDNLPPSRAAAEPSRGATEKTK